MKRCLAPALALFILSFGGAAYAGAFGAPEPTGDENEHSLGVGYFFSSVELKPRMADFSRITLDQRQAAVTASQRDFGFTEDWGGFLRVGASDVDDGRGFRDDFRPFARAGVKGVFVRRSRFRIGPAIEAGLQSGYSADQSIPGGGVATGRIRNMWDVSLALGFQGEIGDRLIVYAGPFLSYVRAEVRLASTAGDDRSSVYTAGDAVGAYGGIRLILPWGFSIEVEGQHRGVASAGAELACSF